MAKAGKSGLIENAPNAQTTRFAGKFINLSAIARAQGLDVSYLSRIFRGQRTPSLHYTQKIAAMLGMTMDAFVEALEDRARELKEENKYIVKLYTTRIEKEDIADLKALEQGKPVEPRLSALRKRA